MRMGLFKHLSSLAVLAGATLLVTNTASATTVTGDLNTVGSAVVTASTINFLDIFGNPGQFDVSVPVSGAFTGTGGTVGTIDPSISLGTGPVTAFMTVTSGVPPVIFDLESFTTSGGSAFALQQQGTGVGVTLTGKFLAYTGALASGSTPYTGTFTTQISGTTVAAVLATIGSGGSISASYSGSFVPTTGTPEPASMLMLGSGLLGIAFLSRRYAKR